MVIHKKTDQCVFCSAKFNSFYFSLKQKTVKAGIEAVNGLGMAVE
jgi:hypothetical protein